jgi:2-phosphosulfolactate phosphatase
LVGSFLNIGAVASYLRTQPYDVLVHCAGWKGKPNLEDTLFAGALVERLQDEYLIQEDAALMALRQYQLAKNDLLGFVANSSHVKRLQRLGIQKDIAFCLQQDLYDIVPVLRGNVLKRL